MRGLILLLSTLLALPAAALTVEVVGSAPLDGQLSYVREQAMKNALQQAALQTGVQVSSTQLMSHGVITEDEVSVRGQGQVSNVRVLWEDQVDGLYQVAIQAEVHSAAMCASSQQQYRKNVAITGFKLAKPMQASLGYLQNIEQDLPRVLTNSLNNRGLVHALDASSTGIYQQPRYAPAAFNNHRHLTSSATLATEMGVQYVVSGVVRDLSVLEKNPGQPSWRQRLGMQTEAPRQFVLDVLVHDGLSGALLYQRSYSAMGNWPTHTAAQIGFATPEFWSTDYGQGVRGLLGQVIDDVNEMLRCQPFMARIIKTEKNRLYIEAGAGVGIRPGDKFQVYRTGTFYNLDLEPRTELTDMATEVVVKQVQPQFIVAEMQQSAASLAIQRDDMVIAF